MLSCSCNDWDGDGPGWYRPDDFSVMPRLIRRKRCKSCGDFINQKDSCVAFHRFRNAESDIEERIHGCEISLPPHYLCDTCGEIYFNLEAAGFCVGPYDDLKKALDHYKKMTGFEKKIDT